MIKIFSRRHFPALVDVWAYSCKTLSRADSAACQGICRSLSSAADPSSSPDSNDINPNFINRNPRNLEQLGLGRKRKGWKFQYPSRTFYHRLVFDKSGQFIRGWVLHSSGATVVSASSGEMAIAKHLYSAEDVSAAMNVGRVLAQRCRECGITCMVPLVPETGIKSAKYSAFVQAMEEGGIEMSEPQEVKADYEPGIDYDDDMEYGDLLRRQEKATQEIPVRWGNRKSHWI